MMPTTLEKETMASIPYVNAIGSLMYLAFDIRPDMAFPISSLAQFFVQSWWVHWYGIKCLLCCLQVTQHMGIVHPTSTFAS
jgi:hypothetical protein